MADFDLKSDEEKAEALKAWWRSNGTSVAAGVALTIGGMFGWNYYQENQLTSAEGASRIFSQLTQDDADPVAIVEKLNKEYGNSVYTSLAALNAAKSSCEDNKTEACIELLKTATESTQDSVATLAKIRLARTLVSTGKLDEAQNILSANMPKAYESLISELDINIGEVENLETINEDVKGKATLFESALIKAWYELKGKEVPEGNAPTKDLAALTTEMVEDAKNILKQTKLTGGSEAYQLGSASAGLTPFWKYHGAINTTPKTDIVIDGKKISLKVGPSQLMSGAGNELTATFYAALKNTPNVKKEIIDDISKSIKDVFVRGTTKQGNVRQAKEAGDDAVLNKAVDKMGILKAKIADFLENNKDFQTAFAYEAATGSEKFGNNDGTANYILSISSNYKNGVLKPLDLDYASKIASKMKLDINMKSGSQKLKGIKTGKYNYYTVLRAGLADLFQDASDGITVDNEITL